MAEEENVAAVLHGKRDIRVERSAPPTLAAHEVLLEIKAVGLCGSDFSYWKDATIAGMDIPFEGAARCQDMCFAGVMGHEASGRVARVGSAVQGVAVGDRVAIEPSITCGACRHCLGGRYNLCAETKYLGSFMSDWPGALRKFISHPASRCYVLPESIGYEEAALFEPLGVALHAVRRAGVKMGDRVLVTGAGPIGLLAMLAARCAGATQIAVADINAQRLALAAGLEGGADQTLLLPAQAAELEQDSYDVALECTGVASCVDLAFGAVVKGATIVLVGHQKSGVCLEPVLVKELDIKGIFRFANVYPQALALVSSGRIDLKANEAFIAATSDPSAIKVVVRPGD